MSEWIPVEYSLPIFPCLTYWEDGKMEAYDLHDTVTIDDLMDDALDVKVTHWMPLPPPPEEDSHE